MNDRTGRDCSGSGDSVCGRMVIMVFEVEVVVVMVVMEEEVIVVVVVLVEVNRGRYW